MELRLEARRSSVGLARHWVVRSARCAGVPPPLLPVLELLTSELVANAVVHGPPDGVVTVQVAADGEAMMVQVTDEGDGRPVPRRTGPEVPGGQGVRLVEQLSHTWGVREARGGGKTVWFEVRG